MTAGEEAAIAEHLVDGGLLVYPTDTLYATGCRALDPRALASLRAAKGREETKAFPVIVASVNQAKQIARWNETADRLARACWPGPLTLVLKVVPGIPEGLLAGGDSIAVRVPASEIARRLAELLGPLVSTSANLAGEPPCVTADLALASFPSVAVVLDAGELSGTPSTIVDARSPEVRILREGRVTGRDLDAALGR